MIDWGRDFVPKLTIETIFYTFSYLLTRLIEATTVNFSSFQGLLYFFLYFCLKIYQVFYLISLAVCYSLSMFIISQEYYFNNKTLTIDSLMLSPAIEPQIEHIEEQVTIQDINLRKSLAHNNYLPHQHPEVFEQFVIKAFQNDQWQKEPCLSESLYQVESYCNQYTEKARKKSGEKRIQNKKIGSILYRNKAKDNPARSISQKNKITVSLSRKQIENQQSTSPEKKPQNYPHRSKDLPNNPKGISLYTDKENSGNAGRMLRIQQPNFHGRYPLQNGKNHGGYLSRMIIQRVLQTNIKL